MASSPEHRARRRAQLNELKLERGCADCGYREHPAALQFDHRPGTPKHAYANRSALHFEWSWERILAAIADCDVVCANCHAVRTAERGYTGGKPMHRTATTSSD